jgi:hypothetical protein
MSERIGLDVDGYFQLTDRERHALDAWIWRNLDHAPSAVWLVDESGCTLDVERPIDATVRVVGGGNIGQATSFTERVTVDEPFPAWALRTVES